MPTVDLGQDDDWLQGLFNQPSAQRDPSFQAGLSLNGYAQPSGFQGHVPAAGAPLNARTLALRPQQQSASQGDLTSSDWIANQIYSWLHGHPGLGVPEEGQENIAGFARGVNQATPWGSAEGAWSSARQGDFPGVVSNLAGVLPVLPGAKAVGAAEDVASAVSRRTMADVPSIRGLPVDQAIEAARAQPHLIPAGGQSGGYYIGGPRSIQSPADLEAARAGFDAYVAGDPRGYDWYDRYRAGLNQATGGDPEMNRWMSTLQGSFSQGVSPQSETGYAIKEANSALAGTPTRAAMGSQHDAFVRAIAGGDPNLMQLGPKTEEYAGLVNPNQPNPPGGTGVNDFRMANQFGYEPTEATTRKGEVSLTAPQHTFMDYETALAADRANQAGLGDRTNWTGEQIQAAPWVKQKALALQAQRPALAQDYPAAFAEANKTAPDFFEKHAANATYELQPGANIPGHMPGSAAATPEERDAYAASLQPEALGRDPIYGGLRVPGTGVGIYTLPSRPMTGLYTNAAGVTESNPGAVARPLVGFNLGPGGKSITPWDASILDAGETLRSAINAQEAGAWNKTWQADTIKGSNSAFVPLDRQATTDELLAHKAVGAKYGLPDAVDTGGGILMANFDPEAAAWTKEKKPLFKDLAGIAPADAGDAQLGRTDAGYLRLVDQWQKGQGSGAVTDQVLSALNTPTLKQAFAENPDIPGYAREAAARDVATPQWGAQRPDVWNFRQLIGEGGDWPQRLSDIRGGAAIPATTAAGVALYPSAGLPATPQQQPQAPAPPLSPEMANWWQNLQNQRFADPTAQ
jgi:hypothetical protein